ncbi:MAG: hypothetical protein IPH07_08910 [Deltaproteobacteria bacterium]|nr:hypothetical protein [Deltaproteobacteria bacterium]MBK8719063.1 hypothetical protein [Deltaproteobacteria bacterium]MBP7287978.1 hypothetical protein [Nannocystaceae bacterium]
MLLFKRPFWQGLQDGSVTLTFRRWASARVRVGGRYRCHPIGVLEVDDVRRVTVASISEEDARKAGFDDRAGLVAYLGELGPLEAQTEVWRVALHHGGDGDRVELALEDQLGPDDVAAITAKLARMDRDGAWTAATLAIIGAHPQVAASRLAAKLGRETAPFKVDVRKLKKLGLTQSFEVGYEISPRGRAYLAATATAATTTAPAAKRRGAGRRS